MIAISRRDAIAKALAYIEAGLADEMNIESVAQGVALSPFHFQRLFFAHTGEAVAGYIKRRRLERAAIMLLDGGEIAIIQIALACGYQSHSAFSKAFKQHFGLPPSAFAAGGGRALLKDSHDSRPFLKPLRHESFDMQVDFLDLPAMWFQYRTQVGVSDGVFFPDRDVVRTGLAELTSAARTGLIAPCGGYRMGPSGFNDASASGHYGGLFDQPPDVGWSDQMAIVPASKWAVFPHYGRYEHLHMTWNKACRNWLPSQCLSIKDERMLETYISGSDGGRKDQFSAQIYVPIENTARMEQHAN